MSDALPLPPRPDVEQYKKLAKDFQEVIRSSEPAAVRDWATRWLETLARLNHREASPQLKGEIRRESGRIVQRYEKLRESNDNLARRTLTGAQFFIAREHGFASWPKFVRHLHALKSEDSRVAAFESAADAIAGGDIVRLRRLLREHPGLAKERSTRDHRSTLLHYTSANGIEDYRQRTPKNIVEITRLLLDAGADVNAQSEAYGGGSTTLGLVATSAHPDAAGVQIDLLKLLLDHGARMDESGAAGNGHAVIRGCLANGQPRAAEFFANLGAGLDMQSAAALGRIEKLETYFEADGSPKPGTSPRQIQDAFFHACWYGQASAAEFLLDRGFDPDTRDEDGDTGLHCAAYGPHLAVIQLLLGRGSRIDIRDNRYNAIPLDMALWVWANTTSSEKRERCYAAVAVLAKAGARLDREHWSGPGDDQPGMLEKIDGDPRMLAALKGEEPTLQ
jgi:ankyrin repeat protein